MSPKRVFGFKNGFTLISFLQEQTNKMETRDIEEKITILEDDLDQLKEDLKNVQSLLKEETDEGKIELLKKEVEEFEDQIQEVKWDIAVYQEMLNKLYLNEQEEWYDSRCEVLNEGDYE